MAEEPTTANLLVVDDDTLELRALCESLHEEGFKTDCHNEPRKALLALREQRFDLLLTDLRMPGMDGITLLQQAREADPQLGVIVLTAYGTVPTAVSALHEGAVDYVVKPVTLQTLMPVLKRSLQLRAAIREKEALQARDRLRTAQLEVANRELELFGARIAHDLREPVTIVRGFGRLLSDRMPPDSPAELTLFINHILKAADRADQLVRDLLAFSRLGDKPLNRADVDLNVVVQQAPDMVMLSSSSPHVEWSVDALPIVAGDASLLEQVFVNLLSNALKYSAMREPPRIMVGYRLDPTEGHVICVRDNGVGFNPEQTDRLFIPFQRLHCASEFQGSGMGLANAKRILDRHGGSLRGFSLPGDGASFTVVLPVGTMAGIERSPVPGDGVVVGGAAVGSVPRGRMPA